MKVLTSSTPPGNLSNSTVCFIRFRKNLPQRITLECGMWYSHPELGIFIGQLKAINYQSKFNSCTKSTYFKSIHRDSIRIVFFHKCSQISPTNYSISISTKKCKTVTIGREEKLVRRSKRRQNWKVEN